MTGQLKSVTGNRVRETDTQQRDPGRESSPGPLQSLGTWVAHGDAALSLQRRFANSLPMFVHTQPRSYDIKKKTHVCVIQDSRFSTYRKPPLWIQKRRGGTRHDDDVFFLGVTGCV